MQISQLLFRVILMACIGIIGLIQTVGCSIFRANESPDSAYRNARAEVLAPNRGTASDIELASYQDEDENDGFGISDLSPAAIGQSIKVATGNGPDREIATEAYRNGEQKFAEAVQLRKNQADVDEVRDGFHAAAKLYVEAAARWPNSAMNQDSLYKAGESFFFADRYTDANSVYEELVETYPGSRYLDRVESRRFLIAQYWIEVNESNPDSFYTLNLVDQSRPFRDTRGNAIRLLGKIRLDDPTGKLADDSTMALANAYFSKQSYLEAAETYEDLRSAFPSSRHQFDAHMMELKARLQAYQGAKYDGEGLEKAETLLKTMLTQFPTQADKESEYLQRVGAEVRYRLAEREMVKARYFDARGENRSARIYYQSILDQYADTPFADQAQERLAVIIDQPAIPRQRARWLVKLFPEPKATKPLIASGTRDALTQ